MMLYLFPASIVFSIALCEFIKDESTPKMHVTSWVLIALASMIWPLTLPCILLKKYPSIRGYLSSALFILKQRKGSRIRKELFDCFWWTCYHKNFGCVAKIEEHDSESASHPSPSNDGWVVLLLVAQLFSPASTKLTLPLGQKYRKSMAVETSLPGLFHSKWVVGVVLKPSEPSGCSCRSQIAIVEAVSDLSDLWRTAGQRQTQALCFALFTLAVAAGNRSFMAIGAWLKAYHDALVILFAPPKGRLPSYSTIRRALLRVE